MSNDPIRTAREVAAEVLSRCDPARKYAGPILNELLETTDQKQRATDLVFGTLRNLWAIDAAIEHFVRRRVLNFERGLRGIIRVATYELIYCPASPEHSVVNEAVGLARRQWGRKQIGFVNAVLRQITNHISARSIPLEKANLRRSLPQDVKNGCQFDSVFLPDPDAEPARHLSIGHTLPEWLVAEWLAEYGWEQTLDICHASSRRPSVYLRPNSLRMSSTLLAEGLRADGFEAEIAPVLLDGVSESRRPVKVRAPRSVRELAGFAEGLFTVQDLAAWHVVEILDPKPSWRILDLCAAPGVKTTQLAEVTGDSAEIVATDIDPARFERVRENTTRLGVQCIRAAPAEDLQREGAAFDAVLVDAPCSNTGVLAKRVEARFRLNRDALESLAAAQRDLLNRAAVLVKPGGRACYSTCSIQKCENSQVVGEFLSRNPGFKLETEQLILPSAGQFDHDGGYVAVLSKTSKGGVRRGYQRSKSKDQKHKAKSKKEASSKDVAGGRAKRKAR